MNLKNKRNIIALFLVIAMVNITPATAMSVGDINSKIESDINTYNGYNWWQKLWNTGSILNSLFNIGMELKDEVSNLKDKALNSKNDAEDLQNKLGNLNSLINDRKTESQNDADKRDKLIAETKEKIQGNINNSLENSSQGETISNLTVNNTNESSDESEDSNNYITNKSTNPVVTEPADKIVNQSTKTELNQTTNLNKSTKTELNQSTAKVKNSESKLAISSYAKDDAEKYVKTYFRKHNVTYSQLELSPSELKNGYIVQLLKDGVFKYWVFEGYTTNGKAKFAILTTGNELIDSVDYTSFANSFTGLVYNLEENDTETENVYHSVKSIQQLQIDGLDPLQKKIKEQTDWGVTSNYITIAGGCISGLGFILATACALFTVILSLAIAAGATVVLGIPCALIATISAWAAVLTGVFAVILLVIGLPLTIGGGIALGECNRMNVYDTMLYNRLLADYNSDSI